MVETIYHSAACIYTFILRLIVVYPKDNLSFYCSLKCVEHIKLLNLFLANLIRLLCKNLRNLCNKMQDLKVFCLQLFVSK